MLGEDHSLVNDFPEYQKEITQLSSTDSKFAHDNKYYTALDKEIRVLEMRDSPIGDQAMQQLKHERSELKDSLYKQLISAQQKKARMN